MGEQERERENILPEEEEEEVAEVGKSGFWAKIKGNLVKILSYTAAAALIIGISVGISIIVSKNVNKQNIREIGGKIVIPPTPPRLTRDMGEFTVNIKSDDGEPHFIKVHIVLGYGDVSKTSDKQLQSELGARQAQIEDIINMVLGAKTKEQLDTPEGKRNLSIELKDQINQVLSSGKIDEIYFRSITVM